MARTSPPPRHSDSGTTPWFAFVLAALIVIVAFGVYGFYAKEGLDALRAAQLSAPSGLERTEIPIPLPKA
ncbi:MAG: hypothetical protein AB7O04_04390 [Hyphomonadaceae bacterium]